MTQRIGIYGGTFDPVHYGHINLAIQVKELHQLDEIWFCPVQISPHKLDTQPTSFAHRHKMLGIALQGVPGCAITDVESKRPGPSFTIDTLTALKADHPDVQFYLIMGDDAIPGFFRWHKPEEIVRMVPIIVGTRSLVPYDITKLTGNEEICDAIRKGITPTRLLDISSTEIRQRLRTGSYCGHLVPEKVIDYICANHIY
ncbi:MAG: nicotinate (nicotinamide) nucleotide adenylyltransferase [Parachlamydiaceae bacterium]|nr:nicotinate (nicotinamide) nucleotide adenylyltransferase [Parachlamydiaceae bacterium]